jgi:hypothetical protein
MREVSRQTLCSKSLEQTREAATGIPILNWGSGNLDWGRLGEFWRKSMKLRKFAGISLVMLGVLVFSGWVPAFGQATGVTANAYPKMAPIEQYRMEKNAEVAMARSAAPAEISKDAEVMVLGARGYESVAKGTNGFLCVVLRSWTAPPEDLSFWNPKLRGPICFNAAAARTYWPIMEKRTELVLAGVPKEKMLADVQASFEKKELPGIEAGAMSYMMSRDQYLGDAGKAWHPHLMFFVPETTDGAWGAVTDSPVLVGQDPTNHLTIFLVPLSKWSDGTSEATAEDAAVADAAHKH